MVLVDTRRADEEDDGSSNSAGCIYNFASFLVSEPGPYVYNWEIANTDNVCFSWESMGLIDFEVHDRSDGDGPLAWPTTGMRTATHTAMATGIATDMATGMTTGKTMGMAAHMAMATATDTTTAVGTKVPGWQLQQSWHQGKGIMPS